MLGNEEKEFLDKIAKFVIEKNMDMPAIMFLESMRPISFISQQAMVFFEPFVQFIYQGNKYELLKNALEEREGIEYLVNKIEEIRDTEKK